MTERRRWEKVTRLALRHGGLNTDYYEPGKQDALNAGIHKIVERAVARDFNRIYSLFQNDDNSHGAEAFFYIATRAGLLSQTEFERLFLGISAMRNSLSFFPTSVSRVLIRRLRRPYVPDPADRKRFDQWQSCLTVYRGVRTLPNDLDDCGFCWTVDRSVAEKFATDWGQGAGFLIQGVTPKHCVWTYTDNRSEAEVILLPEDVCLKTVRRVP